MRNIFSIYTSVNDIDACAYGTLERIRVYPMTLKRHFGGIKIKNDRYIKILKLEASANIHPNSYIINNWM